MSHNVKKLKLSLRGLPNQYLFYILGECINYKAVIRYILTTKLILLSLV
jgi:hypothetical protein